MPQELPCKIKRTSRKSPRHCEARRAVAIPWTMEQPPKKSTGLPRRFAPRNDGGKKHCRGDSRIARRCRRNCCVKSEGPTESHHVIARRAKPDVAIRIPSNALHCPSPSGGRKENGLPRRFAPRNDGGSGELVRIRQTWAVIGVHPAERSMPVPYIGVTKFCGVDCPTAGWKPNFPIQPTFHCAFSWFLIG